MAPDWSGTGRTPVRPEQVLKDVQAAQRKVLRVTGVATSPDGMVRAVVGPRGHLIELHIDPRIYRRPDAAALSTLIVQTVRTAIQDAIEQGRDIITKAVPRTFRPPPIGGLDFSELASLHDADLPPGSNTG
jgi:DNA-binding protein YbaB